MRCRRVRKLLPIYEDGGLPARTIEGIETHLADCSDCRQEASELDDALSVLRAVPKVRPAPEFKRAIMAAVRRESVRTRQGLLERVLVWQPVFATAGVAACILVGALAIWHYGRQTTPPIPMAENPVEIIAPDNSPEVSPTPVVVASVPDEEPRVAVPVTRRPRRARPRTVINASVLTVGLSVPEEPAPEVTEPEVAEETPAPESPVVGHILGFDVLIGDILLSDLRPPSNEEDGFILASMSDEVEPAAFEEPVGAMDTEIDPTTL